MQCVQYSNEKEGIKLFQDSVLYADIMKSTVLSIASICFYIVQSHRAEQISVQMKL